MTTTATRSASAAFAEPQRAVSGAWIAAFAAAWLGIWMAQLAPLQVMLPIQVDSLMGIEGDWRASVLALGTISGIAGACSIIAFPLTGFLSDRTTSRFGRRRPWVVVGALVFGLSLLALGFVDTIQLVGLFWALAVTGYCVLASAMTALISDQVPVRQRGYVSGWMSAPQAIGIILGTILVTEVFLTATLGYLAMAIGLVVLVVPILFVAKEIPITKAERPEASASAFFRGLWIPPRKHPDFAWTLTSRVLVNLGNALGTGLLLYFLAFGLEMGIEKAEESFLPLVVVYLVAVVVSALALGWLSDRMGRRKVFVIWGSLLQAAAAFVLVFVSSYEAVFIGAALLGLGYGSFLAVDQALATQVLPDPADRGKDLGIMNIAQQVPQAMALLLGAVVVASLGGFSGLFMLSAFITLIGAIVVTLVRDVR